MIARWKFWMMLASFSYFVNFLGVELLGVEHLAFRIPNENDAASTTKFEIVFPTDRAPMASVFL